MRRVVLQIFCEFCWYDNVETPATGVWTLGMKDSSVTAPVTKLIDVCQEHHDGLSRVYEVFVQAASGRDDPMPTPPKVKPAAALPAEPPDEEECALCQSVLSSQSGLVTHIYKRHVPGGRKQFTTCPECGYEAVSSVGLAAHRRLHNVDPVQEAYDAVPKAQRLALIAASRATA